MTDVDNARERKTVLVVEDEELNLKLVMLVLEKEGFAVIGAKSAEEAFEALRAGRPDLILMDIKLPGMDGLEATRRLKADPSLSPIPVIAVSAYAMDHDFTRAFEAGCNAYVTKPFDRKLLMDTIRGFVLP